jgi:membrane associated rhomboid family serine protease
VFPIFFFIPVAVPAILFLGIWFLGQFAIAGENTNVAWQAHVGGFLVGIVAALFLRRILLRRIERHRRALRLPI